MKNSTHSLTTPISEDDIRSLSVGDRVNLSGVVYTGRDAVHADIFNGKIPPVDLQDNVIYHCGPVITGEQDGDYKCVAAGPTTSSREEPYQWMLIKEYGLRGIIGKGGMGEKTKEACLEYGCCYFHAIGGAAQVYAEKISVETVSWEHLGSPEAIWHLKVKDFPLIVTIDAKGNNLHEEILNKSMKKFNEELRD